MATDGKKGSASLSSSLTDLMTSLMVIFVLLLVATLNNMSAEGENTRNVILDNLTKELRDFAKKGVTVGKDPKDPLGLLVLVPERALKFEEGDDRISQTGSDFLNGFTPSLAQTTCSDKFRPDIGSIVVEGYTNSNGTDEKNLGLSQRRSLAVVQKMLSVVGANDRLRTCFLDFVSATGRGSRDPVPKTVNGVPVIVDGKAEEDKEASRRVLFKIRVRPSQKGELQSRLGM